MKRDPLAEEQIAAARAYHTAADRARMIEDARAQGGDREADAVADALEPVFPIDGPTDPLEAAAAATHAEWRGSAGVCDVADASGIAQDVTRLTGDDHAVFAAFADLCAKLEAHQRTGADLMREYQAQLAKVSAMAARHAR